IEVKVMLARLYYKPDPAVPSPLYVKAHLAIANAEGVPIHARYDAAWEDELEVEYKEFDTAETHELIIAMISTEPPAIATVEHRSTSKSFKPESHQFEGSEFRLRLELIGKYYNDTVLNQAFDFALGVLPQPWMKLV